MARKLIDVYNDLKSIELLNDSQDVKDRIKDVSTQIELFGEDAEYDSDANVYSITIPDYGVYRQVKMFNNRVNITESIKPDNVIQLLSYIYKHFIIEGKIKVTLKGILGFVFEKAILEYLILFIISTVNKKK